MNHKGWDGIQDGTDNTARAASTPFGVCIEYSESTYRHFGRVGAYFEDGPGALINPGEDLERDLALQLYAYSR